MRKCRQSELPCIRTKEPYRPLARAIHLLATLETVLPFILKNGPMFQHKTLLYRSMFNMGKDFLQITLSYKFLNGAVLYESGVRGDLNCMGLVNVMYRMRDLVNMHSQRIILQSLRESGQNNIVIV